MNRFPLIIVLGMALMATGCNRQQSGARQPVKDDAISAVADDMIAHYWSVEANLSVDENRKLAAEFIEFADAQENDEVALKVLLLVVSQSRRSIAFRESNDQAVRQLLKRFPQHPETEFTVYKMYSHHTPDTVSTLQSLLESDNQRLRSIATFSLACKLGKKECERAIEMLQSIADREKELLVKRDSKIVDVREKARQKLFELRNLQLGMAIPKTEGTDLEGNPIRLSDYRGKVVLLSFWADW